MFWNSSQALYFLKRYEDVKLWNKYISYIPSQVVIYRICLRSHLEKLFIIIQTQWTHTLPSSYSLQPRPYTYTHTHTHTHTPLLFPTKAGKHSWNSHCHSLTSLYHNTCFAVKQLGLVALKDVLLKKCPRFPSKSSSLILNSLLFLLNDIFIVWEHTLGKKILWFLCHNETYVDCNIRALSKSTPNILSLFHVSYLPRSVPDLFYPKHLFLG